MLDPGSRSYERNDSHRHHTLIITPSNFFEFSFCVLTCVQIVVVLVGALSPSKRCVLFEQMGRNNARASVRGDLWTLIRQSCFATRKKPTVTLNAACGRKGQYARDVELLIV